MIDATVVGYGMGKVHCDFVRSVEGLNLYAVCDIDEMRRQN
jgi:predicted dehydrogenase